MNLADTRFNINSFPNPVSNLMKLQKYEQNMDQNKHQKSKSKNGLFFIENCVWHGHLIFTPYTIKSIGIGNTFFLKILLCRVTQTFQSFQIQFSKQTYYLKNVHIYSQKIPWNSKRLKIFTKLFSALQTPKVKPRLFIVISTENTHIKFIKKLDSPISLARVCELFFSDWIFWL